MAAITAAAEISTGAEQQNAVSICFEYFKLT